MNFSKKIPKYQNQWLNNIGRCLHPYISLQIQFLTLKTGRWQIDRLFIRFSIGGILFSNSMNNLEINVPENAFGIMDTRQLQIDYYSSFESYMQYN